MWRDAAPAPARRLTAAQLAAFNRDGFFVLRDAFTPAEIAAVAAEIDPLEDAHAQFARARGGRVRLTDAQAITFTLHLVKKSPALAAFAAHPAIKDVVHDLIGPDVRLYWDQAVYKKTEKPQEFP